MVVLTKRRKKKRRKERGRWKVRGSSHVFWQIWFKSFSISYVIGSALIMFQEKGLCLVDWGKGINLHLFHDNAEFKEDCWTSGFRCIEMQENRPWKFQEDTYGLCVIVHMMLHNSYMEVEKKVSSNGSYTFLLRSSFKRYWNVDLWKNLFTILLNSTPCSEDIAVVTEHKGVRPGLYSL